MHLIEISFLILVIQESFAGYMVCACNLDSLINLKLRKLNLPSRLF